MQEERGLRPSSWEASTLTRHGQFSSVYQTQSDPAGRQDKQDLVFEGNDVTVRHFQARKRHTFGFWEEYCIWAGLHLSKPSGHKMIYAIWRDVGETSQHKREKGHLLPFSPAKKNSACQDNMRPVGGQVKDPSCSIFVHHKPVIRRKPDQVHQTRTSHRSNIH